jgi:Tol biopolymer transport system component
MPDGSVVLETGTPQAPKLWVLPSNDGKPTQWLRTPFAEYGASVSGSGSWIAYASNQTGASEVWVRPFPGPGAPVRVSSEGGSKPIWSRNGKEIFFENGPKILAARVMAEAPEFRIDPPRVLFEGDFVRDDTDPHIRYTDVAADGRFLMVERTESAGSTSIVIAHHWDEDLKRLIRN